MKKRLFYLIFISLFIIGCGGSTPSSISKEVVQSDDSMLVQGEGVSIDSDSNRKLEENISSELTGFAKIQDLIKKSRDGVLSNVTYLCVGDSTRAFSDGPSGDYAQKMFERVKASLDTYSVNSILLARGSQELAHFLEIKMEDGHVRKPTYKDVILATPDTGATTIIDFCLGINDLWDLNIQTKDDMANAVDIIKDRVIQSIELIQLEKPDVNFVLTSPSPLLDWEEGSEIYSTVYKEVSKELNLPFINYVDNIMPSRNYDKDGTASEEFQAWYRHEDTGIDPIHFSEYGLYKVADYILGQILPKD